MRLTTVTESTGTNVQHKSTEAVDYVVRFSKEITSTSWDVQATRLDTSELWCWIQLKQQEMQTLKGLVGWQHKLLDYNSHYCAFLLGQVEDDEFEKIAESYSYETKDANPDSLTPVIEQIYRLTEIEYTPSDLASFFGCRTENVVEALKPLAIANRKLGEILPITNQE